MKKVVRVGSSVLANQASGSWRFEVLVVPQGATRVCAVRSYIRRRSAGSDVCFLMAARTGTASWASSKNRISPPQPVSRTSSAPVVSIDRISPRKNQNPPMVSQITLGAPDAQPTVLEAMSTNLTGVSADTNPTSKDSFLRHDTYFFKDGNITFLVRITASYEPLTR